MLYSLMIISKRDGSQVPEKYLFQKAGKRIILLLKRSTDISKRQKKNKIFKVNSLSKRARASFFPFYQFRDLSVIFNLYLPMKGKGEIGNEKWKSKEKVSYTIRCRKYKWPKREIKDTCFVTTGIQCFLELCRY